MLSKFITLLFFVVAVSQVDVKLRAFLDINWDEVLDVSNNTIDEMCERFKQIILEGMNNFIPRGSK